MLRSVQSVSKFHHSVPIEQRTVSFFTRYFGTLGCSYGQCPGQNPGPGMKLVKRRKSTVSAEKNLSYYHKQFDVPLEDSTIGRLLNTAAERWPNRECVVSVHQNLRLSFIEAKLRSDKLAAGLKKLGLQKGDRVGIWAPNLVEWYLTFLAVCRAGFVTVGINPAYQQEELVYCLNKVGVRVVVAADSFKTQNYPQMLLNAKKRCPVLEHIVITSDDHVTGTRRFVDVENLASRLEVQRIAEEQHEISPFSACNIQFTSGTTGLPKAALLCHRALFNNARKAAERTVFATGDYKICMNVPFFHVFGITMGILASLHAGNTLTLQGPSFNPKESIEVIAKEKCNVIYGTPTMWVNLVDAQNRMRLPLGKIAGGVTGGAIASVEFCKRARDCFRTDGLSIIYGLTEVTTVSFQTLLNDPLEEQGRTVGLLADYLEAKVVDENGNMVPFGTTGELWQRGYTTMLGYWNDEESTKKTIMEDGWLKTGDCFILHPNGYGEIVGRLKDVVIRGGENIFPKEIEQFLETHEAILEAHVIGAHDEVYGEELCACIRVREGFRLTKEDIRHYAKGKIAHFKVPRYLEVVDNFPKTTSGKIRKNALKEELQERGVIPSKPKT